MARQPTPKNRRATSALAAAGLASILVLGQATVNTVASVTVHLVNTVIGAGGLGDPPGRLVPALLGATIVPAGYVYAPVRYPANVALASSRDLGVPVMRTLIAEHSDEDVIVVAGYSEGSLVAEKVRRRLQTHPEEAPRAQLGFTFIASPFAPNGGIFNRFPGLFVPGIIDAFAPAKPTGYDTDYYALMYDTYADFPAYFNPVALLNSLFAPRYAHPDNHYDPVVPGVTPAYVTSATNTAGGTDKYVLIYNQHLPLLGPLREFGHLTSLTRFIEPLLSAVEPVLRVLVDMGYTDRVNANPEVTKPFSLFTPPAKFVAALKAIPGALAQGATNLAHGGHVTATPPPSPTLTTVPTISIPDAAPRATVSATTEDDLHPHVTSTGNKATPGATSEAPSDTNPTSTPHDSPDKEPAVEATATTDATPSAPDQHADESADTAADKNAA